MSSFFLQVVKIFLAIPKKPFIMQTMKVTGAKIREFREGQNLTQAELAERVQPSVTRQAVELWEKNGIGGFKTLNRIAKALNVPPALLIDSSSGE